jgi:hypothetical protein
VITEDDQRRFRLIGLFNQQAVYLDMTHPDKVANLPVEVQNSVAAYRAKLLTLLPVGGALTTANFDPLNHDLPTPVFAAQPTTEGMTTI